MVSSELNYSTAQYETDLQSPVTHQNYLSPTAVLHVRSVLPFTEALSSLPHINLWMVYSILTHPR